MSSTEKSPLLLSRLLRCLWKGIALLTLLFFIIACLLLIRASFVNADALYNSSKRPAEVQRQLDRLAHIVHRSATAGRLDIYTDYTEICGEGIEWDYGFYTFYALCLEALVQQDPTQLPYACEQIELCTRLMLQLPVDASVEAISQILPPADGIFQASLVSGYQCLVLGIRRQLTGDPLYDDLMRGMARALEKDLRGQLKRCQGIYTSDQSTQLHALWRVDQSLETDHSTLFQLWMDTMQAKFIDPRTELLHSRVSIAPDRIDTPPRATSVAWSIIFLEDIFPYFAKQQYIALHKDRIRRVCSMAAIQEFPELNPLSLGDMDSGPMLLGVSPAATGFTLYAHKRYGTRMDYTRAYRIFELFGLPTIDSTGQYYRMANGMGDAILLYSKMAQPDSNLIP